MVYCNSIVKCVLLFFNVLMLVIGLALIALGVLMKLDVAEVAIITEIDTDDVSTYVIALGSVVTFITMIGCFGGCKEQKLLLTIYSIFMLILMVSTALLAVLIFLRMGQYMGDVKMIIHGHFNKNVEGFSSIEKQFHCCGPVGSKSYTSRGANLSDTCCGTPPCRDPKSSYPSCVDTILPILKTSSEITGGVSVALAITQLIQAVLSVYLAIKLSKKYDKVRIRPH